MIGGLYTLARGWLTLNSGIVGKAALGLAIAGSLWAWWQWREHNLLEADRARVEGELARAALEAARDARKIETEVRNAPIDELWACVSGLRRCAVAERLFSAE